MKRISNTAPSHSLPVTRDLKFAYRLSLVITLLMTAVSLSGLCFPATSYPTDELLESYLANDAVNLIIGLPILLGSVWLTRRGNLVSLLCWPGALLYILYNYIAYLFGMPFGWITFAYLVLVLLSAYTIFDVLKSIDANSLQEKLSGAVPVKVSGWILVLFGGAFLFRAIGVIVEASMNQRTLSVSGIGTLVADMVVSALWVIGGVLLLRQKPLGYICGLGLLFTASMLFIGVILLLLLRPVLTDTPFVLFDVVVLLMMGAICFIPFALFVRGVISKRKSL